MNVGIVILIHRATNWIKEQVATMEKQKITYPVCIVDNSEKEEEHLKIKTILSFYPELDILYKETKNEGYFQGNFSGCQELAEKRNTDYAFILNPDVTSDNWEELIARLSSHFEKNQNCFITGPKVTIPNYKIVSSPIIPFLLWREILYNVFFPFSNPILKKYHTKLSRNSGKVFAVEGSAYLIDIKKMREGKDYFKDIFLYGEETIFGKIAQKYNWDIYFDNSVKVLHHHPPGEISPTYDTYMPRSYARIAEKFYTNRLYIRIFTISMYHRFRVRKFLTRFMKNK